MRFHSLMLAPIGSLLGVMLVACGDNDEPKAPIPYRVDVVGVYHDVDFRTWCDQSAPCDILPRMDVHWEVDIDGRVKVMHIWEELRFQRGTFDPPDAGHSTWVADESGDYLLATTGAMRALIIHYPLTQEQVFNRLLHERNELTCQNEEIARFNEMIKAFLEMVEGCRAFYKLPSDLHACTESLYDPSDFPALDLTCADFLVKRRVVERRTHDLVPAFVEACMADTGCKTWYVNQLTVPTWWNIKPVVEEMK